MCALSIAPPTVDLIFFGENVNTTCKIVSKCRMSLKEIARHSTVALIWVSGHRAIDDSCKGDDLAKAGASIETTIVICELLLRIVIEDEASCFQTCKIWPDMDISRVRTTINLSRHHLRKVTGIITGHRPLDTETSP